jgi:hypothetical protein
MWTYAGLRRQPRGKGVQFMSMEKRSSSSLPDLCRRHGFGLTTAYKEIKSGRLQVTKLGRRTIITDENEAAFLRMLSGTSV